jgi:hypothetical protein
MLDQPIKSSEWATYFVTMEVPLQAHSITIACALAGQGMAWFGDLELMFPGTA